MYRSTILVTVLLALSTAAYRQSPARSSELRRYSAVSNKIGYRVQRLQSYEPGNQLISPYGISTLLSAVYEGAEGRSRQQIERLGYGQLQQQGVDISETHRKLRSYLQRGFGKSQLEEANVFLYPSDYSISPQYQEVLESSYRCLVQQVDYQRRDEVPQDVDRWVQEQTNGKISQIVNEIGASSGIALLNGIYYQGQLQSQSRKPQQQRRPFQNEEGSTQQSVLYYQTESRYRYYEDQELQAVEIPYHGGEYSLLVVLPSQERGIKQVQQQVDYHTLQSIIRKSQVTQVSVAIPQFSLDYSRDLQQDIQSLGVTSIFGDDAQIPGVSTSGSAYISQIAQRAVVQVGKYGGQQQYSHEASQGSQYKFAELDKYRYDYQQSQDSQYGQEYGYQDSQSGQYGVGQDDQYWDIQGYPSSYQGESVAVFQADRPFLFYVIHKPTGLNLLAGRISQL